jgi:hypothetical protein
MVSKRTTSRLSFTLSDRDVLNFFTSNGEDGSHQIFPLFTKIMNKFYPHLRIESLTANGIDFEDIAAIHQRLDKLYDELNEANSYGHNDIMVDVTGGQKTNSIAAAITTLSEGRHFQYLSTKNKEVRSYDLVIEKSA